MFDGEAGGCQRWFQQVASAAVARDLLEGGPGVADACRRIVAHENRADLIAREVLLGVRRSFITPFDRGDIKDLIGLLDDAIDQMQKTAKTIRLFDVSTFEPEMKEMADAIVEAADVLQIPAFLCRQTDLLLEAGRTGRIVNVKKGQFLAPLDMKHAIRKVTEAGNDRVSITERGFTFGYNNLVVDMRGLWMMRQYGAPVIFDATHSVQQPASRGDSTGGDRTLVEPLARAAAAVGIDGLFLETHPDPDQSPSDGPNMVPLDELRGVLQRVLLVHEARLAGMEIT